ncbi:MAG: DUF4926 domain-containing protein [Cyanobacteria bacterium P01_D01_bin.1]
MKINEYDVVALTEDHTATHAHTQQALMLRRGQVGTILMIFQDQNVLIDFADSTGQTYAMETVSIEKIMPLLHEPVVAVA